MTYTSSHFTSSHSCINYCSTLDADGCYFHHHHQYHHLVRDLQSTISSQIILVRHAPCSLSSDAGRIAAMFKPDGRKILQQRNHCWLILPFIVVSLSHRVPCCMMGFLMNHISQTAYIILYILEEASDPTPAKHVHHDSIVNSQGVLLIILKPVNDVHVPR